MGRLVPVIQLRKVLVETLTRTLCSFPGTLGFPGTQSNIPALVTGSWVTDGGHACEQRFGEGVGLDRDLTSVVDSSQRPLLNTCCVWLLSHRQAQWVVLRDAQESLG